MLEYETELLVERQDRETVRNICYERYLERGGILNEVDYQRVMEKTRQAVQLRQSLILQAEQIAKCSGVVLNNFPQQPDEVTILYGVLRTDEKPGAENHHGQMSDQRLFAEALKMLDRLGLLVKVMETYPNIFEKAYNDDIRRLI